MNQEWDESRLKDYTEDDFLIDDEINDGILEVGQWYDWYYSSDNDTITEESLEVIDQEDLALLSDSFDYGMTQPTGLYGGRVLLTMRSNISSLDEIKKGFDRMSQSNIMFLYNIYKQPQRIIQLIPTKANPEKTQTIPEYYRVRWAKLGNNYDKQV